MLEKGDAMKRKVFCMALMLCLCFTCAFAQEDCDSWQGTWDVTLTDGGKAVWVIDYTTTTDTGSDYYKCLARGTQTQSGKEDIDFQIIYLTFVSSYLYYGHQNALSQGESGTYLTLDSGGDSFAATAGKDNPYKIASGVRLVCTDADKDGYYLEGTACGTAADCDDSDATINPGEAEVCDDGIDNNCDGQIDEGCGGVCVDNDNDTYGINCAAGLDCDDTDPAVNPGATESCDDGIDNDCDNMTDCNDSDCANDAACQEPEPSCSIVVDKPTANAGAFLPRPALITITGTGDDFDTTGDVSFDNAGVVKLFQSPKGTDGITVLVLIMPKAKGATVSVSVDGCEGTADIEVQ